MKKLIRCLAVPLAWRGITFAAAGSLFLLAGCATPSTARVVLDRDAVKAEEQRQRVMCDAFGCDFDGDGKDDAIDGKHVSQEARAIWEAALATPERTVTSLATPILEANADLCGTSVRTSSNGKTMCDHMPFYKSGESAVNAYTDGKAIYISAGMLRFVQSEAELQAVIAHELAHITEGHINKKRRNAAVSGLFGALVDAFAAANDPWYNTRRSVNRQPTMAESMAQIGGQSFSKRFEQEADYISVYMLARAGVDTDGLSTLWRRMGADNPSRVKQGWGDSHPSTAKRVLALEQAHAEVRAKQELGCPLIPEPKEQSERYDTCPRLKARISRPSEAP